MLASELGKNRKYKGASNKKLLLEKSSVEKKIKPRLPLRIPKGKKDAKSSKQRDWKGGELGENSSHCRERDNLSILLKK